MKKIVVVILTLTVATSCVTKKVYTELEDKYNKLRDNNADLFGENQDLIDKKKALEESSKTLQLAIEQAGGISALAKLMPDSPSRQAVDNWTKNGLPSKRAVHIEIALKGRVRRQELRPDLYA